MEEEPELLPPMRRVGPFPDLCPCPMPLESRCHKFPNTLGILELCTLHGHCLHLLWFLLLYLILYSQVDCMSAMQVSLSHTVVDAL